MTVRLLLVRHGQTAWNADDRFMGQTDIGLSPAGEQQAARVALRPAREPIDAAYASTLERAGRTAEIALDGRGIPVTRDSAWSEASYGEWEGFSWADVIARDPDLVARRRADLANTAPPGGETFGQLQRRLIDGMGRLLKGHDGSTVLIVAHGGPLRVLAAWCMGLGPAEQGRFVIDNGGLSAIQLDGQQAVLEFWNETAHLTHSRRSMPTSDRAICQMMPTWRSLPRLFRPSVASSSTATCTRACSLIRLRQPPCTSPRSSSGWASVTSWKSCAAGLRKLGRRWSTDTLPCVPPGRRRWTTRPSRATFGRSPPTPEPHTGRTP